MFSHREPLPSSSKLPAGRPTLARPTKRSPASPKSKAGIAVIHLRGGRSAAAGRGGAQAGRLGPPSLAELAEDLRPFVGAVLPDDRMPDSLVVAPPGQGSLYGGLLAWAKVVRAYVAGRGLPASVVVGFDPPYAAAIAAQTVGVALMRSARDEQERAKSVRLRELGLPRAEREQLASLGVRTLGDLLDLPLGDARALEAGRMPHASRLLERFVDRAQLPLDLEARMAG